MKATNNLVKIVKNSTFLSKQLRPKDFISDHPSNVLSESRYIGNGEEFKIRDLGYLQRSLSQPKSVVSSENQVGYHIKSDFGPNISFAPLICTNEHASKRQAHIYQRKINHMQCTPLVNYGDSWVVEVNTIMDTRHGTMLWGRGGSDAYNRWGNRGEMSFSSAEEAIAFCVNSGWDYEIMFGGFRYHQTKSYAENFTFRKEELSDTEEGEVDFKRI